MERIKCKSEGKGSTYSHCPRCKALQGHDHAHGCPEEKCPKCGEQLITCSCMALSTADTIRTLITLAATLDFNQVYVLLENSEKVGDGQLNQTYIEKAAILYFYRNASDKDLMKAYRVDSPSQAQHIAAMLEMEELKPGFEHETECQVH